jgi:hypothetical protein
LLGRFLTLFLFIRTADGLLLRHAGAFGDAVTDVAHRIEPRHVLFLEEVDSVALALGEKRHQHIRTRHFVAAGILHMKHGALDNALETSRGLGILAVFNDEGQQFFVDIFPQGLAKDFGVDIAGLQNLGRIGVVYQSKEEMFERGIFMMTIARELDGAVQGLFETTRE